MPVTATAVASGIGVVGGAISGSKANKQAKAAMSMQQKALQDDLAWRQMLWNHYQGIYGPIEEQLAREAQSREPLDYGRMVGQINTAFSGARQRELAGAAQRGMAGSGLDVGAQQGLGIAQAGALTGAYAQGMAARRALAMGMVAKDPSAQLGMNVSGGLTNMANLYGSNAAMNAQAAAQSWQGVAQGLGGLASMYGQYKEGQDLVNKANQAGLERSMAYNPPVFVPMNRQYNPNDIFAPQPIGLPVNTPASPGSTKVTS